MMKSFFKKLAVVLAMAMVVSLAAPAAVASAADTKDFTYMYQTGVGTAVKTVNLAKAGDTVDLKFVGIPDYTKYDLNWMSVGKGFTVDDDGVITATADTGSGSVWLSVGDDQYYISQPINVTIGEYTATIGKQGAEAGSADRNPGTIEVKIGETVDLAFFGILDWNLGKYGYKWLVGNDSILSVDQKTGEITALKAGETTVTFAAPSKFHEASNVVTEPLTVVVKPSETTFEVTNNGYNTTHNEVVIEFSEKYAPKSVELFRVFVADDDWTTDGKVDENLHEDAYESVYVNNHYALEGNEYLINPYVDFVDGAIYEIRIDGLAKVWFKASVGAVAKVVVVEDVKGSLAEEIENAIPAVFSVNLYDANNVKVDGVKVDGFVNESPEYITFSLVEDGAYSLDVNELTFYDYTPAKVVATYNSSAVKNPVESSPFTSVPNKKSVYGVEEIIAWTAVWDWQTDIDWNNTNHWMSASDTNVKLAVLFKDTRGEYYSTDLRGAGWDQYNGKYVNYTGVDTTMNNGEGTNFANYGYYVEFKAMDPDNLLIDVDGRVQAYKKTSSRWALYLYNYKNQVDQFEKEIFSAILPVDAERKLASIDASSNEFNLMYYTEEEAGTPNAYYSDFSVDTLFVDLRDQFKSSWWGDAHFVVTSVTSQGNAAFEALLDSYEAKLNTFDWDDDNYNDVRDEWITIELVDYLKVAGDYSKGLIDGKTSFSFIIKETTSGATEKITVNFKTPTDYILDAAGAKEYQGFAVVLESKLTDTQVEERFDLSTNNSVNLTYATDKQWEKANKTNNKATQNIVVFHKDSKGYKIGYENDLVMGVKAPSYNGGLKKFTLDVDYLTAVAAVGTKVLIVTDPYGNALQTQAVGNGNAALTVVEKRLYAGSEYLLAPATGSGLGVTIKTNTDTYAKDAAGTVTNTSYNYFNIDFMNKATSVLGGEEITFLAAGNYKATLYTVEGYLYDQYKDTDNKYYYTGDTDKDGVIDAGENWVITDVIFSGNSQFKQTTTLKITNNLPQITFAKRLNATTTDYLGYIDASQHDDPHVKELIAENFEFNWNGEPYRHHNNRNDKITADDIIAYTVKVSSNNQIVVQNVTFKIYVDWNNSNNGDLTDEDVWYRSTCTVNQSLTYMPEN